VEPARLHLGLHPAGSTFSPRDVYNAERHALGAADSGSEARADAGSRRLHALAMLKFMHAEICSLMTCGQV
jgi:hypothetical protein